MRSIRLSLLAGIVVAAMVSCQRLPQPSGTTRSLTLADARSRLEDDGLPAEAVAAGANLYQWPLRLEAGDVLDEGPFSQGRALTLDAPAWLFYLDYQPEALYGHPTAFVLVEATTGAIRVLAREGYPVVNDNHLFSTDAEQQSSALHLPDLTYTPLRSEAEADDTEAKAVRRWAKVGTFTPPGLPADDDIDFARFPRLRGETDEQYRIRVRGLVEGPQSSNDRDAALSGCDTVACTTTGRKFALIIEGEEVGGHVGALVQSLATAGYTTVFASPSVTQDDPDNNRYVTDIPNVTAAFARFASLVADCCDEALIVIHAHGSPQGEISLNPRRLVPVLNGAGAPTGQYVRVGRRQGGLMTTAQLKPLLDQVKSCKVQFFFQTCYAGSHLEAGLNELDSDVADTDCICRTIVAAASGRQPAWTSNFLQFRNALRNGKSFREAVDAHNKDTNDRLNPSFERGGGLHRQSQYVSSTGDTFCLDGDNDSLIDGRERVGNYSDPKVADTDGDGIPDGRERVLGSDPRKTDTDGDGLTDREEEITTPFDDDDPDDDGKPNILDPDSDDDGLSDGDEVKKFGTNHNERDTDGDGIWDDQDYRISANMTVTEDAEAGVLTYAVRVFKEHVPGQPYAITVDPDYDVAISWSLEAACGALGSTDSVAANTYLYADCVFEQVLEAQLAVDVTFRDGERVETLRYAAGAVDNADADPVAF